MNNKSFTQLYLSTAICSHLPPTLILSLSHVHVDTALFITTSGNQRTPSGSISGLHRVALSVLAGLYGELGEDDKTGHTIPCNVEKVVT
jgi:hypothetical protein